MLLQVESAVWPAWATGRTDHQAQHAVPPAAGPFLVGFGQQVVDGVHPLRVHGPQRLLGEIVAGIEEGKALGAFILGGRRPAEMLLVVAIQRRAAAGVGRVEEEVLHIDRDKFLGAADFVQIRAAHDLVVVLLAFAPPAHILLPASEVEQARVIAKGKAALGLPAALIGQANQPCVAALPGAATDQCAFGGGPEAGAVINVRQLVQHGGEHFPAHSAVGAVGLLGGRRAVGECGQQLAVEVQLGGQRRLAVGVGGHVIGPAHQNLPVQLFNKTRWQALHCFIKQGLAGLLFSRAQALGLELQMQRSLGAAGE